MANSYSWSNNTSVTGDISSFANLTSLSTGMTFAVEETPEEARTRKKKLIKSIIDDDKYLLQELLTELRKEKLDQLKDVIK